MPESEKWKWSCSVMSDPQRPDGLQPTRLLCPWDFPGKSTGVGCHCLQYTLILFLYFCGIGYFFSSFISYFIWVLSFLLMSYRFVNVVYLKKKKKQVLILFIFSIFQSLFYLFPLRSILFPSFYWILFFLLFQILLDEKDCLKFSFFLRKICIAMNRTVHSFFFFCWIPWIFLGYIFIFICL